MLVLLVDVLVLVSVEFVVVEAVRRVYKRFGSMPRRWCHIYSTWKLSPFTSYYVDAQWRTHTLTSIDWVCMETIFKSNLTFEYWWIVNCVDEEFERIVRAVILETRSTFQTQYTFRDVKETFDLLFPQKVDLFCSFIFLKAVLRRILKSNIFSYMVLFRNR